MSYIRLPTDAKHTFWKKVRHYKELSGDWSGGAPIVAVCQAAEETAATGRLPYLSSEALENALGWKGKKGKCADAMLQASLISKGEEGFRIVDWEALGGHILKFHHRARKAAKALWEPKRRVTVDATSIA